MRASTSRCISQCATFCSMYCSVIPLKTARCGSSWKKHAEMPIFSMMLRLDRRGEHLHKIVARALARIRQMTGIVNRDVDERRNIRLRNGSLRHVSSECRRNAELGFHPHEPVDKSGGARFRRHRGNADDAGDAPELGHPGGWRRQIEAHHM